MVDQVRPTPEDIHRAAEEVLARDHYHLEPHHQWLLNLNWLEDWLDALFGPFAGAASALPLPVTLLLWGLLILGVVALLLAGGMALMRARRGLLVLPGTQEAETDPLALERIAFQLADAGNYVDASRKLFHAALAMLESKRGGRLRLALTNSEYLETFRTSAVIENLGVFVRLINEKWYRDMCFERQDFMACREAYDRLRSHVERQPG